MIYDSLGIYHDCIILCKVYDVSCIVGGAANDQLKKHMIKYSNGECTYLMKDI